MSYVTSDKEPDESDMLELKRAIVPFTITHTVAQMGYRSTLH